MGGARLRHSVGAAFQPGQRSDVRSGRRGWALLGWMRRLRASLLSCDPTESGGDAQGRKRAPLWLDHPPPAGCTAKESSNTKGPVLLRQFRNSNPTTITGCAPPPSPPPNPYYTCELLLRCDAQDLAALDLSLRIREVSALPGARQRELSFPLRSLYCSIVVLFLLVIDFIVYNLLVI